ncbi:MAG TPA: TonB-dependent receptor, partial [Mucilaginibacter sp.]|nr:TonB-dependent receptor [Mucilaginibacter sp.]
KTLPELLNTVPGITFSGAENAPGIATSVYLHGASNGNTLILVDGFPVNNAATIDNGYDLNAFPLDQIDHIEILKGSGSTLYGSDAVAGVINIITKHPKGEGLKASVQLAGGSYNTFNESVGLNGNVHNTGIALNLSNSDSRGFPGATDTTGKGNFRDDGFRERAVSLNLTQKVTDKFSLNGNLQTSYDKGNLPYGAYTDDQNNNYDNTFLFGGIGAKWLLNKGTLNVNLSQNTVWNHFDNEGPDNDSTHSVTRNVGRITDAEAVFNYSLNKYLDLTSGAGFKYNSTRQNSLFEEAFYHPGPSPVVDSANSIASAFASLFFKSDIFHMELGGRFNHHSTYGNNFTYTINPSVFLFDQLKVFATVASAFKAPSLYQLYSEYGNIGLKPETTNSYEAGFDWEIVSNTLSLNTDFYKRDTKDVIYFASTSVSPYGKYENGSKENDKGFESELDLKLSGFTASAYMAYVSGALTDARGIKTDYLLRRPKTTFGASINYQVIKTLSVGLIYKYTGDRIDQDFSTYPATNVTLKNYNLFDGHVQWQACKRLELFADLRNMFDEKYTDWLGYNTRGRNFMAGLRYNIN